MAESGSQNQVFPVFLMSTKPEQDHKAVVQKQGSLTLNFSVLL